jgi:hypothetical protein
MNEKALQEILGRKLDCQFARSLSRKPQVNCQNGAARGEFVAGFKRLTGAGECAQTRLPVCAKAMARSGDSSD